MRDATVVDLYNASMNGWFIIDTRPKEDFARGSVVGAEHADTPFWELPDDPRHAVILTDSPDSSSGVITAALGRISQRVSAPVTATVCSAPFSTFASRFPFAVMCSSDGSMTAPSAIADMPCMPASVADGLWLGAAMHAERPAVLAALRVAHVVALIDDPGGAVVGGRVTSVQRWPWVDSPSFCILGDLTAVADAIEVARAEGGVLVHCFQGKSRSAAAVVAWMLKHQRRIDSGAGEQRADGSASRAAAAPLATLTVDAAHAELRRHRSLVQVNDGFLAQLRAWNGEGL
jgi:hypothetical protein